ncbi:interleukin-15-like isoform X2 [Erpetoichthys calabaricus]|uniref:interleukin-15-like isoform X2 n=1 Tax=Erpetoichthys calabaricus TaxID=27687 RepID=UPI002234722C|nr:interleukin-15-like isoform X2 [Erpetoichthys calabaricus]
MESESNKVKHIYIYCYFHLSLGVLVNSHGLISLFFFSYMIALLPLSEGNSHHLTIHLVELQNNLDRIKNSLCPPDVENDNNDNLYTPHVENIENTSCNNSVLYCFTLEMQVLIFESESNNILKSIDESLQYIKKQVDNKCKGCEEETERPCQEFLEHFLNFVQRFFSQS